MPYNPWTEEERGIITGFLQEANLPGLYPPKGYTRTLAPLLPGRNEQDIRNGVHLTRKALTNLCLCGKNPLPQTGQKRCAACVIKIKTCRQNRILNNNCPSCGDTLDQEGASTALCPKCRERKRKYTPTPPKTHKKRPKKTDPNGCQKIIPFWPGCGNIRWIAQTAAALQRPVIDIFGGTGEMLRLVALEGGTPHAYYDADPRIVNLITGTDESLISLDDPSPSTLRIRIKRLRLLRESLRHTTIECKDALQVLSDPHHPHNAIFLCDPPWPGTKHPYAHTINHHDLIEALLALPHSQDFILSLGAERQALNLVRHYNLHAFWRIATYRYAKSLIALSPRLAACHPMEYVLPCSKPFSSVPSSSSKP